MKYIDGLPPAEWLSYCDTRDRMEHWFVLKGHYHSVLLALQSYFEGDTTRLDGLPDFLRAKVELFRDDYLKLYALLFNGWTVIKSKLNEMACDHWADGPKKLFFIIIGFECKSVFLEAFPAWNQWDTNPYEPVSLQAIYRARDVARKPNPSSRQQHKKLLKLTKKFWGTAYRDLCESWIADSKPKKGGTLHRALIDYKKIHAQLIDEIYQEMHPRKAPPGYRWTKDGKRIVIGTKGRCNTS